jgi:hypothetical protein
MTQATAHPASHDGVVPGFRATYSYRNHRDPWLEQRDPGN